MNPKSIWFYGTPATPEQPMYLCVTLPHAWEQCCVVALGTGVYRSWWEQEKQGKMLSGPCSHSAEPLQHLCSLFSVMFHIETFLLTRVAEPLDKLAVSRLWKGRGDMVPLRSHISGSYIDCILKFTSLVPLALERQSDIFCI